MSVDTNSGAAQAAGGTAVDGGERSPWPRRIVGALAGLLAAGTALGVAQLAAAAVGPDASPVIAVGGAVVDRTPEVLRTFAIETFGTNDKVVLLGGIVLLVVLYAAAVGVLAMRHRRLGLVAIAAFGLVGAAAALSRPGGGAGDAVPSLLGAAAGAGALLLLVRAALRRPARSEVRTTPAVPLAVNRRGFLVAGVATGAFAASAGGAGRALLRRLDVQASRGGVVVPTPASPAPALAAGTELGVPGVVPFITPNDEFYRVDTALIVPRVKAEDWTLRIHGMVDRELTLDFEQLLDRPMVERDITLTCVSNEVGGPYVSTARWVGVPVRDLLEEVGVDPASDQLVSRSIDGWTAGTPVAAVLDGRDAILAVSMNGEPLPLEHGFPVRMVVPGLYGYTSACKWIVDMELTTFDAYDAYWVQRDWARVAPIKVASRIDAPKPFARVAAGPVAVGGVAYAQRRGIDRVEVRVDGGPWQDARLGAEGTVDTWRQWSHSWNATPGSHRLEVRATDRTGRTQPEERVDPIPDGATGWHSVAVTVT